MFKPNLSFLKPKNVIKGVTHALNPTTVFNPKKAARTVGSAFSGANNVAQGAVSAGNALLGFKRKKKNMSPGNNGNTGFAGAVSRNLNLNSDDNQS